MTSSPLGLDCLLEKAHGTQENMFTDLLKVVVKDKDEQPAEQTHRARWGKALSSGASVPVKLESLTLLARLCPPTWELSQPPTIGIFLEASSLSHVGL